MSILDISDFLKSTIGVDEHFYYRPNPGNAGDALMATASLDLFDTLGLNYTAIFPTSGANEDFTKKVLVLGGGGNFNETGFNNYAKIVAQWHKKVKRLIVLPHTVSGNEALLSSLGGNVDIICREKNSNEHVKNFAKRANVFIAHDMAFSLNVPEILSWRPNYAKKFAKRVVLTGLRHGARRNYPNAHFIVKDFLEFSALSRNEEQGGVLNVFRGDIEKTNIAIPNGNIDLSLRFQYGLMSRSLTNYMTCQVFSYLNHFDTIRTNRLHICIAAALLNKRVELFSNNYFKVRAIYEHSLENTFPKVVWCS